MTDPAILFQIADVAPALAAMELDRERLIAVIRGADAERMLVTKNDPKGFDLVLMNAKVARRLREEFCGERWERDETDNQPGIRNPHLKLRIIPCNFDANAGNRLVDPTNLREKGGASRAKARCNATAWLPGLPRDLAPPSSGGYVTYVLGSNFDGDRPLQAELSRPETFWDNQYQTFGHRIILLDGSDGAEAGVTRPQEGPTEIVDIAIKRK